MSALTSLVLSLLVSLVVAALLVRRPAWFRDAGLDRPGAGPQNLNRRPVPRLGGLAIGLGLLAGVLLADDVVQPGLVLLACGLPALLAGVAEDLTRRVSAWWRLLLTAVAAGLAAVYGDAGLAAMALRLPADGVWLLPLCGLASIGAVCGVSHAVNLIDGFNGLAAGCMLLVLLALALVGWQVDDDLVVTLALVAAGATLGFLALNFPHGHLLLGDGGAYLLGFIVAELALLLVLRHAEVSPLLPLLLLAYPVWETLFTIWRRRVLQRRAVMQPDALHLHSLVYRRGLRSAGPAGRPWQDGRWRNPATALCLWPLCLATVVPAAAWWHSTPALAVGGALFCLLYGLLYGALVRLRLRRLLRLLSPLAWPWPVRSPFGPWRQRLWHGRVTDRR